jgi:hypothetical protein
MFCSNCGAQAAGNFCSVCGSPLKCGGHVGIIARDHRWENDFQVENIVKVPAIRNAIAQNASNAVQGVSAEAIFALYDKIISSPFPMERIAAVIQPLYDSWGIRVGKERVELLHVPIGRVIAQTLCSFAKHNQTFQTAHQIENGCWLIAELPSSICSLKGKLQIKLILQGDRTRVEASTIIPGQVYDRGKGNRCLDQFFIDQRSELGLPAMHQKAG